MRWKGPRERISSSPACDFLFFLFLKKKKKKSSAIFVLPSLLVGFGVQGGLVKTISGTYSTPAVKVMIQY